MPLMDVKSWRVSEKLSQSRLADHLGLRSRGQVADIESGRERASAEIAIKLDRLTRGKVPVHEVRPDLHDVRVVRSDAEAQASA